MVTCLTHENRLEGGKGEELEQRGGLVYIEPTICNGHLPSHGEGMEGAEGSEHIIYELDHRRL